MSKHRTRIKICGITRAADGLQAADLGVDALGLVFHPASPRAVSAEQAYEIVSVLPPFVTTVGLFVNATPARIRAVLDVLPLDVLQFHGDESAEDCRRFGRPYMKALRVRPGLDLARTVAAYPDAQGILLDAWHQDQPGGTGKQFDWALAEAMPRQRPLVLAGGLAAANVGEAIQRLQPAAVDVSSGVEASPGQKSAEAMAAFVAAVRAADGSR